jgi:hypothetical protein
MKEYWYRNAGSYRYHLARTDYVQTGRAVCGQNIGRAYMVGAEVMPIRHYERLCQYPRRYGMVDACGHCKRIRTLIRTLKG